jgi:hypothetical protein
MRICAKSFISGINLWIEKKLDVFNCIALYLSTYNKYKENKKIRIQILNKRT